MIRKSLILVCSAAWSVFASSTLMAEPLRLRIDWSVIPGQFAPLIPTVPNYAPNVYRHYGKSYVVEPIRLQGGGATLTALAADQIEVAGALSPQALVLGVVEAKLNMRVIGQVITTELPGYQATRFWVRKQDIKSIADLRGKVIAVNARGANVDSAAHIVMARAGMQEPKDYQIVEVRFPAMIPTLESRKADAVPLVPPFDRMAMRNPELAPLFSVGDAFGPVETLMFGAKAEFVAKNRAALVDFLEDNIRMRRWMTDPNTRMQAVKQLSDTTKIPASEYADWVYTHDDYYYHPQALVNAERLQGNIGTLKEVGVVPAAIDAKPYIDMTLAEEAAARIKD
jgi:NitT/TauT family transport system substrate-binding protein